MQEAKSSKQWAVALCKWHHAMELHVLEANTLTQGWWGGGDVQGIAVLSRPVVT